MEKLIGAAIVGQSGGPTAAINATLAGVIRQCVRNMCTEGTVNALYGMKNGIEGFLAENIIDLGEIFTFKKAPDDKKLSALATTPASALGSCRKKLPSPTDSPEFYENLVELFKKHDIRYFFYIGGNDSMDTVAKLGEYMRDKDWEMRIIGLPKTIDNDLVGTDHTPGYGCAAKYVATTISEIVRDCAVYTVPAVTIVEVMGRDAGWLTAAASLPSITGGGAPDLIYLPEVPFTMEEYFEDVKSLLKTKPNIVVAVSEGIRFADGKYVCEGISSGGTDVFGHKALTGTGKALELATKAEIGCKVRSVELNICQRCASHISSLTDIRESEAVGMQGVRAALSGSSVCMMAIRRLPGESYVSDFIPLDVTEIANKVKHVPLEFINDRKNYVTKECSEYILPLIEGEIYPEYKNGLPEYFVID